MLDFNQLLKHEELVRKANLLKTLKTTFESLMFDRGAQFQWNNNFNFNFNGNLSLFCKIIHDILLDGIIQSSYGPIQALWSFLFSILFDQEDNSNNNDTTNTARDDFKLIYQKITINLERNDQNNENLVFDWILNSLRQLCLLNQLNFVFKTNFESIINSFYSKNSFILDKNFLNDFLIYIRAFEQNNLNILSKCKLNLYALLNQPIETQTLNDHREFDSKTLSEKSSLLDLNSISSSPLYLIETPKELGSLRTNTNRINQHRRIHSFPNIQINLFKKTNPLETLNASDNNLKLTLNENTSNNNTQTELDEKLKNPIEIPKILLNDVSQIDESINESSFEQKEKEENYFFKTSIFDFIKEIQINSECSPLDKENSHFLLADLAISSIELIKTQKTLMNTNLNEPESNSLNKIRPVSNHKLIKSSSSIKINNKTASVHNMESFDDHSGLNSALSSPQQFQTISENANGSQTNLNEINKNGRPSMLRSISSFNFGKNSTDRTLKMSNSLTDLANLENLESIEINHEKTNELDDFNLSQNGDQKLKHRNWITNNNKINAHKINSDIMFFKLSADSSFSYEQTRSNSPSSLYMASTSTTSPIDSSQNTITESINRNPLLNEDGFEVVETGRTKTRKFSWEDIDNMETAEFISNKLIKKLLDKDTNIPNIGEFEFFLKFLEYQEVIQHFYYNSVSTNKLKKNTSLSLLNENSPNLSASSIYLSHFESPSPNLDNKRLSITSFHSSTSQASSSYQRVKTAAFQAGTKCLQNKKVNEEKIPTSNGRIIGDDLWAPVREQLILNLTPKQKRFEQIAQQHFRCADCGIEINQDHKQIKTFNYCEYFCKYFCRCCHTNQTSYIPAYIINLLDFRINFEVSKKAKNFLEKIYTEPLITLESLNSSLFQDKSNIFSRIKKIRLKLYSCRSYINSCRFAQELKSELYSKFDDFIINDQHVYSIETLFKIKRTNYCEQLKLILNKIVDHIKSCELCSQQGYICGLCTRNDLLYPFDLDKVEKCPNCLACYHKTCFKSPDHCPRCIRKKNRQSVLSK